MPISPEILKTARIMIVDEDQRSLSSICDKLETAGFNRELLVCVEKLSEAVNLIKDLMPSLILVDINIRGENQYSLCSLVRAGQAAACCVLFTAYAADYFAPAKSIVLRGHDCIVKPIYVPALLRKIERCFKIMLIEQQLERTEDKILSDIEGMMNAGAGR